MKTALYIIMVLCFFGAGAADLYEHEWKAGICAIGFGILNAIIFLWR